jgi:pimeloyl-ACP methyl ester carboxylesterase
MKITDPVQSATRFVLVTSIAFLASACGGGSDSSSSSSLAGLSAADACTALGKATVPTSAVSLAVGGVVIDSATLKASSGSGATAVGEYCAVKGHMSAVNRPSPAINFQVNLPSTWNGKAFQLMGGGYDGVLVDGTGSAPSSAGFATPLAKGYTSFGSDSGHSGTPLEGSFALDDEALENYFGDQLRKTRDVAVELMKQRYGSTPSKTYAAGGSGGGREALYVADRWPDLYDGVIAYYPAWSLTAMLTNYQRISSALAGPGAYPNSAKQALVASSVISACDSLDGVADGIVSNTGACHFDPTVLRCADGADTGNTCLSDAQLQGIGSYAQGLTLPFPLNSGVNSYPAFNLYNAGTNLAGFAGGSIAPTNPITFAMPFASYIGDSFIKYWVMRDPSFDSFTFNAGANGFIRQRLQYISSRLDVRPDLRAFASRGGKLILVTGQADSIIPSSTSIDLYDAMGTAMGAGTVTSFSRFYYVPGYDHGFGPQFNLNWDSVTALEAWVERGTTPAALTGSDANPSASGRTRPPCEYPTWPRYNGVGGPQLASSFTCAP